MGCHSEHTRCSHVERGGLSAAASAHNPSRGTSQCRHLQPLAFAHHRLLMQPSCHRESSQTLDAAIGDLATLRFCTAKLVSAVKNAQRQNVKLFVVWTTVSTMLCQRHHLYIDQRHQYAVTTFKNMVFSQPFLRYM